MASVTLGRKHSHTRAHKNSAQALGLLKEWVWDFFQMVFPGPFWLLSGDLSVPIFRWSSSSRRRNPIVF